MRRLTCTFLLVPAFVLAAAAPSYAEGGKSIASATPITVGQQEFGNTDNLAPGHVRGCEEHEGSFWALSVTAGDTITIDWEAGPYTPLDLLPVGTTDFNLDKTSPVASQEPAGNGKNELTYVTDLTGTMPLELWGATGNDCMPTGSPYSFTVYITHAISVKLPRVSAVHSKGTLTVAVHNPEGGPINAPSLLVKLEVDAHGSWHTIGVASVANSAAVVHYRLPAYLARQRVAMRAIAVGPQYKTTASSQTTVSTL